MAQKRESRWQSASGPLACQVFELETAPQILPFRLQLSFMTVGKRHAASMFMKELYSFDELDHSWF